MQHTKYYLHASYNRATHEDGYRVAHEIELAYSTQKLTLVSHASFGLSHSTKIQEHMRVATRECQLRVERYRSSVERYVPNK